MFFIPIHPAIIQRLKMRHSNESAPAIQLRKARWVLLCAALSLAGCETLAPTPPVTPPPSAPIPAPVPTVKPVPPPAGFVLRQAAWADLPGWRDDNPALAWDAFLATCDALKDQEAWRNVCSVGLQINKPDRDTARRFFEFNFTPYQLANPDGSDEGLVTGYYEPLLHGSRKPSGRYRYPLYGVPDDLLVIDFAGLYPELKGMRLRGRLEGRRVVPYYDRAEIENGKAAVRGKEIAWVDDPIDLFFLQIQGSGRIELDSGETLRVGYADQNGYPYSSIGRWLVERGELPLEKASMQGIKAWARQNPDKLSELLNHNASYVFFRELPAGLPGPLGALGVPLTAERSMAIDPRAIPLGAPVFLATTRPNSTTPLAKLMLAQDTGGAIRGNVRADYFWGFGADAGREAGRMRQQGRMWVLLPRDWKVEGN
jgi:membrane-bound lytic murein transglycosylase A